MNAARAMAFEESIMRWFLDVRIWSVSDSVAQEDLHKNWG